MVAEECPSQMPEGFHIPLIVDLWTNKGPWIPECLGTASPESLPLTPPPPVHLISYPKIKN